MSSWGKLIDRLQATLKTGRSPKHEALAAGKTSQLRSAEIGPRMRDSGWPREGSLKLQENEWIGWKRLGRHIGPRNISGPQNII